jgi:hypothetical protein
LSIERKRPPRLRVRPALEGLEQRTVLTTFRASTVAQLVADVAAVNNSTGPNKIILAAGTYVIPGTLQIQNANDLTIVGRPTDPSLVNIMGQNPHRVMEVDGGSVTLSGVTLEGGGSVARGAGLLAVNANVTLSKSTITGNSATQTGGGVYVQGGTLNVLNSSIDGNSAGGGTLGQGGGIAASNATIVLTDSAVASNTATSYSSNSGSNVSVTSSGGGIYAAGGSIDIKGTKFTSNEATAYTSTPVATANGGAFATTNTSVSIAGSGFQNNNLTTFAAQSNANLGSVFSATGGSVTIASTSFTGNTPTGWAEFDHPGATVTIRHSKLDGRALTGTYTMGNNTFTQN